MLARDEVDPVLTIAAADKSAVRRVLHRASMGAYAATERRLKIRLTLIYGTAILGVVILAVWIRLFSGNTTLIRGSIMFMMWRGSLGSSVAFVLSAVLVAMIGIPLVAVLLAWNWRRAAAIFVLYGAAWAACAFMRWRSRFTAGAWLNGRARWFSPRSLSSA